MSRVQFTSMINVEAIIPGERITRVEDFTWKLPKPATSVSFHLKQYNLSQDAQAVLVIYDLCEQGFLLPLLAATAIVIDPYPYEPYTQPRARAIQPIKAPAQVPPRTTQR